MNIQPIIDEHKETLQKVRLLEKQIAEVARAMISSIEGGGKIIWMGNGGSAADSQHFAAELVGRFQRERSALPSISLTVDTSVITSISNDYGFESVFRRQIEGLCRKGDLVVGISTSGNSRNVLDAINEARKLGAYTVALTGKDGGKLAEQVHTSIIVPSEKTARIQEMHLLIGHIICEMVEEGFQRK